MKDVHKTQLAGSRPDAARARHALSDRRRLQIWEALREAPMTAKELAARLSVEANGLYYHLKLLEQSGIVHVVETRWAGRTAERVYAAVAGFGDISKGSPEEQALFFAALLDATREELTDVVLAAEAGVRLNKLVLRTRLSLSPMAFRKLAVALSDLAAEFKETPEHAGQEARLTVALYQTVPDEPAA